MNKKIILFMIIFSLFITNFHLDVKGNLRLYSSTIENGQTLFVGGNGTGNYTKIQDAINDAINGDTIFIYEKKYNENLKVNKSITIIGQNRENTIVDGSHASTHAVSLKTDDIKIFNLTFFNNGGPNGELAVSISSNYCNISNCIIRSSSHNALGFGGASYNTIYNCLVDGDGDAIRLMSDYNKLINCEICCNHRFGALISGSHNLFLNCSVHDNGEAGIRMSGNANTFTGCNFYNNGIAFKIDKSRDHRILDCLIHDNRYDGIRLWQFHPSNVTIRNCDIFGNKNNGINIIQDTVKTTVENCRVYDNGNGITIGDDSLYNSISNTTVYNNNYNGFKIVSRGNYNIIKNCLSFNNSLYGLYLDHVRDNQIIDTTIENNSDGTYIGGGCHNNIILRCSHLNNENYGLLMSCNEYPSTDDNSIIYCLFRDNKDFAIKIEGYCFRNSLHHNIIIDNSKDVSDTTSNNWDDGREGNFYSLYRGKDADNDGIGDQPYYIGRYNFDRFPLMSGQIKDPRIVITFPDQGFFYIRNQKIFPIIFSTIIMGTCEINTDVYSENINDIDRVEFHIDGVLKEVDIKSPYSWIWSEKSIGKHNLRATVYLDNGNYSTDEIAVWKFL